MDEQEHRRIIQQLRAYGLEIPDEEPEKLEHKGSIEIIPPHIAVQGFGWFIPQPAGQPRPFKVKDVLHCTECDAEVTVWYKRSRDAREQNRFDDDAAEVIIGFVGQHTAGHRQWRGM